MTRSTRWPLGLLAGVVMGAQALAQSGASGPASPPLPRTALERQDIRAQLTPVRYTTLASEIGAKVNRLPVREGTSFKAGELLVGFDCLVQETLLQKAVAELTGAEFTLAANQRLAELNSVGQLDLDLAKAAVAKAKADVATNQTVLTKCQITAPFDGRVAEQKVREQQFVQPGTNLLDVLDDSALELEFLVPSGWLRWLKTGHRFKVSIDETGKAYPARVTRLGARVDPISQSVKVSATVDGHYAELVPGMSGRVQIGPVKQP